MTEELIFQETMDCESAPQIIAKFRQELKSRGLNSLKQLGKFFMRNDKNKNGLLDKDEFNLTLKEAGFSLTQKQLKMLYAHFDKNGDGQLSYDEFINVIRGGLMNESRLSVVREAF